MASIPGDATHGHLLGGSVQYAQPRHGFRSGIEPVLLAASVPAKAGDRVLEGGSGAGAALLCVAARVAGVDGVGVERDAPLTELATQNAAANNWPTLCFITADVTALPDLGAFDHAIANPPYHAAGGTPSPDAARHGAKHAPDGLLAAWAGSLARILRPRGSLTCILPAASLPEALAAFAGAACQPSVMLPLWPRAGEPAKLLLLRGVKGGRMPFQVLAGLVLHAADGGFTPEAEAILRGGGALPF